MGLGRSTGALHGGSAVGLGTVAAPPARDRLRQREQFEDYGENDWTVATEDPLATFSIDVDTASYAIARRDLNRARLPNPDGIRVEEFINVFDYGYVAPIDPSVPFAVHLEASPSHFGDGLQLLRVGIQGFETELADRAPANLVFLVDTSGSMRGADKMGLVQYALGTLLSSLGPDDTLSIVTYSGRAETLLPPTHVDDREAIMEAIEGLNARGSTNGADGIRTAYEVAQSALIDGATNRVIWCTDGDLNVGMTGDELLEFVEDHGRRGVALTTLGFGRGNLNDRDLERYADRGDGNYHYIDDQNEALRVLGDELMGTLEIIARDVKIQVEVNPHIVDSYRIIGYENRDVADADFRNDSVDAGEIGSGHNVTALLELDLNDTAIITRNERLATVRVRYEEPNEDGEGREIEQTIYTDQLGARFEDASASLRLAAAVAEFAEVLRRGENATGAEFDEVERVVRGAHARGDLQVEELAALVTQAKSLWRN
ncbi:MAG: Ca-activated chloride channel family protein [Bradymonadia bacterium]|jgi:Ca-activated chloride channel family protein